MKVLKKLLTGIKNKIISNKSYIYFFIFLFTGILLTLYVEYKFQYEQFKWLGWRTMIISAAVLQYGSFTKKVHNKFKLLILKILAVIVILFIINFLANLINIYHLDRFVNISNLCSNNNEFCNFITNNFYDFKIYRFISLTPYFFFYVIFLLIGLMSSDPIYKSTSELWKKLPKIKIKYSFIFYLLIIFLIFQQMVSVFSIMSRNSVKMLYTLKFPFEERWEPVMGGRFSFGWIKTYSDFVNNQVPQNSTILIPDQTAPWEMEGNPHYIRWFFYPRTTVQMTENNLIPLETKYILISDGVFGYKKKIFPTFEIKKELINKIILVNKESLEITIIKDKDFIPEEFSGKWGVIKLK